MSILMSTEALRAVEEGGDDGEVHLFHRPGYKTSPSNSPGISSGAALVQWYRGLFAALSTLGTFGAGFTLNIVTQNTTSPNPAGFNPSTVTHWAAISSILFVLTVLVSQGCSQFFKFEQVAIAEGIDTDDPGTIWTLATLSLLLQGQVLSAFLFLELVLMAHAPTVGKIGIALTSCLAFVALVLWFLQITDRKPISQYRGYIINRVLKENESEAPCRARQMPSHG